MNPLKETVTAVGLILTMPGFLAGAAANHIENPVIKGFFSICALACAIPGVSLIAATSDTHTARFLGKSIKDQFKPEEKTKTSLPKGTLK